MKYTFKGGIHIDEHKNTAGIPIDKGFSPEKVYIPMQQHIGAPCECVVKKGDRVLRCQLIGEAGGGLSLPVHSSVSGTVSDVCDIIGTSGQKVRHAVIENDGLYENCEGLSKKDIYSMRADEAIEQIRLFGISGMGGATFPTYAKIRSALGKVDTLIVNCSECEPYITANHRLLLEEADAVIEGTRMLLHIFGLKKASIAIADNKPDAIALFKEKLRGATDISVKVLKTKYPQGDERQLIYAITKRRIPTGKLPADVGAVVFNTETAYAVEHCFSTGEPLVDKTVTVDGDCVRSPKCVKAPIGTRYRELIDYCGGTEGEIRRLVSGGAMMGFTVWSEDTPVSKGCSSVLAFTKDVDRGKTADASCIRCGKCTRACPMYLLPAYLAQFARKDMLDKCESFNVKSCVECGSCSYVCPAKIPVSQYIKTAKAKILAKARRDAK